MPVDASTCCVKGGVGGGGGGGVITDRKFNLVERESERGRERTSVRKSSRVNFPTRPLSSFGLRLNFLLLLLLLLLLLREESRSNTDPQLTFTLNSLMVALDDSWSQTVTVSLMSCCYHGD